MTDFTNHKSGDNMTQIHATIMMTGNSSNVSSPSGDYPASVVLESSAKPNLVCRTGIEGQMNGCANLNSTLTVT